MRFPLYVTVFFCCFLKLYLCHYFLSFYLLFYFSCHFTYLLITIMVWIPWVKFLWALCVFWIQMSVSFTKIREIFSYFFFKYIFSSLCSLFSFWDPYYVNVIILDVTEFPYFSLIFYYSVFLFVVQLGFLPLLYLPVG